MFLYTCAQVGFLFLINTLITFKRVVHHLKITIGTACHVLEGYRHFVIMTERGLYTTINLYHLLFLFSLIIISAFREDSCNSGGS